MCQQDESVYCADPQFKPAAPKPMKPHFTFPERFASLKSQSVSYSSTP